VNGLRSWSKIERKTRPSSRKSPEPVVRPENWTGA
jgi:hypothetical protein